MRLEYGTSLQKASEDEGLYKVFEQTKPRSVRWHVEVVERWGAMSGVEI